ncbi:ABC transporter substrate-binding protein [Arthrobacter sp. NPDC056691]|uniref:ABC transporter substrate-binding protein n=1 Tax=Arthrobacter sp. NPDC056691 TaxID=3345913 RepID=UPI00366BC000
MKNFLKATALLAAGLIALSGCSDPGSASTNTAPAAWPDVSTKLDGVNLTIWAAQNSNSVPKSVVSAFEAKTGAKVNVVTIPDPYEQGVQTKIATGDKPDLAFWQPTASMLTAINAKTNLQSIDGAPWLEKLKPAVKDITGILDNTRYASLITSPAVEGVYYNKDVFAKAGITTAPKNWDDFLAAARTIKKAGTVPFFEMGGDKWATQWWVQVQLADAAKAGLWDKVNQNQEKFTDPTILTAVQNYKGLIDEGLFNPNIKTATFADQADALLSGKAAMAVQVNSFFGQLQAKADTAELNKKIGFFPISPAGNVATVIPDQSNALIAFKTGDATREAAARQLLGFWMGEGYQDFVSAQKTVSLETDAKDSTDVPQALLDAAASLSDSVGSMQSLAVANPDLYLNLADMIQGTKTPQQVTQETQTQFAQLAKAQGAAGF